LLVSVLSGGKSNLCLTFSYTETKKFDIDFIVGEKNMMNVEEVAIFLGNENIKSTFSEGTSVMVTKDYSEIDPYCMPCFTKGVKIEDFKGHVLCCGISSYSYDPETQFFTKLVENIEWCYVELSGVGLDEAEGYVKVENLEMVTDENYDQIWSKKKDY